MVTTLLFIRYIRLIPYATYKSTFVGIKISYSIAVVVRSSKFASVATKVHTGTFRAEVPLRVRNNYYLLGMYMFEFAVTRRVIKLKVWN